MSGGTIVAIEVVSDIPHTSQIGIPIAAKNSSTSSGQGAAPIMHHSQRSSPSLRRIFEYTARSARSHASASSAGTASPGCSSRTFSRPTSIARFVAARTVSSASASIPASSAAFSFSQIRGTPPQKVGRQSATCANTCVTSGQQVTVWPQTMFA